MLIRKAFGREAGSKEDSVDRPPLDAKLFSRPLFAYYLPLSSPHLLEFL